MRTKIAGLLALMLPMAAETGGIALAQAPAMNRAQAMQLYAAGGFPISPDGKNPTNRCGQPASPRITFVDMNDDRRPEALFIDRGACYRPDGSWYAIATQGPDGQWRRVLDGEGTVNATGTAFNGWFVLTTTSGGRTTRMHYDGTAYGPAAASPASASPSAAPPSARAGTAPLVAKPLWSDDADAAMAKAELAKLSAADRLAILRAAGLKPVGKGKWTACTEDDSGHSEGDVAMVRDINGDGRAEAMVRDGGIFCNGMAGVHSTLLTRTTAGAWKPMFDTQGFIGFLESRGTGNYPDIEVGLPGSCFPYFRWNGGEYRLIARLEDRRKPCTP